jgi:amidohydrolase
MSLESPDADIEALVPRLRDIRHDLHKHPELGFEEERTQRLVRGWLSDLGYAPKDCAKTGLIADLRPDLVGKGPTIALRADLDCLPMDELTDLPYRSVHPGRAHKCGHDGHTSIMLGVSAILARHRQSVAGNVRLLFQPAEEGVDGGGARVMVAEGALEDVSEVYGLHNWPGYPKGEVRVISGPIMAEVHKLEVDIVGVGGHGSQPQRCRDPIVAASSFVTALQTVVSRGLGYEGGAVVSIGSFQSGSADNVIPDRARLLGTVRTFTPQVTARVTERIEEVAAGIAAAHGVRIEPRLIPGYPVLVNDADCAGAVESVARDVVGPAAVSSADLPMAGSEDFAFFARERPSAYFFLGAGRPGEDTPVCHHPDFDFDDDLIPTGMAMFLGIVRHRFAAEAQAPESG